MAESGEAKNAVRFGRYSVPVDAQGEPLELGRGGMGVTYRARDTKLDRDVVLKVVSGSLRNNSQARQKFLREARLLARMSHPHIAAVHDIGEDNGQDYYVMEFIDGEDLGSRVNRMGSVQVGIALEITRQAADALAAAWKQGLIHRDIKPANIMLAKSDGAVKVKVIDFGLAKAVGSAAEDFTRITLTGEMSGYSPAFASPEQIEGEEVDTRSDIYSLGITLWYLLAGRPPFSGTSRRQVENAHISQPPPVHTIEGSVPPPVVSLLKKMLAKTREERHANPEELADDLRDLVNSDVVKHAYDTLAFSQTVHQGRAPSKGSKQIWKVVMFAAPALALIILVLTLAMVRNRSVGGKDPALVPPVAATPVPDTPPTGSEAGPTAGGNEPNTARADFIENSLGMRFVAVPGAKVLFSIWETRVQDFEAFTKANPTYDAGPGWKDPYFPQSPLNPVVFVSWDDAVKFCDWLTIKERADGSLSANEAYRLPTDEEWSIAAGLRNENGDSPEARDMRAKDAYPWRGSKWPPAAAGNVGNYAASLKIPGKTSPNTMPVGSFEPNVNGIFDLGGNAWEWVQDWYDGDKGSRKTKRVLRGASWLDNSPSYLLSSCRQHETPETRLNAYGFRVVRTTPYSR